MLARHYDSMGRTTSMYTHSVGPTRRPRVHRQPNQPTPLNHQDPCTTRPPTHRHLGVHHFGSALPTQRAENGASQRTEAVPMIDAQYLAVCNADQYLRVSHAEPGLEDNDSRPRLWLDKPRLELATAGQGRQVPGIDHACLILTPDYNAEQMVGTTVLRGRLRGHPNDPCCRPGSDPGSQAPCNQLRYEALLNGALHPIGPSVDAYKGVGLGVGSRRRQGGRRQGLQHRVPHLVQLEQSGRILPVHLNPDKECADTCDRLSPRSHSRRREWSPRRSN